VRRRISICQARSRTESRHLDSYLSEWFRPLCAGGDGAACGSYLAALPDCFVYSVILSLPRRLGVFALGGFCRMWRVWGSFCAGAGWIEGVAQFQVGPGAGKGLLPGEQVVLAAGSVCSGRSRSFRASGIGLLPGEQRVSGAADLSASGGAGRSGCRDFVARGGAGGFGRQVLPGLRE